MAENEILRDLADEELAAKAAAGSRVCFSELVGRYSTKLFHFLRKKTSSDSDAEDAVQETFIKAFVNIRRFNAGRRFSTWLYTIAAREAINLYRANRMIVSPSRPQRPMPRPDEIAIQKEENQNLWKLARSLKASQYDALWLRYVENLSVKEIAQVMKKSKLHVRVLLHRARNRMAGFMTRRSQAAAGFHSPLAVQRVHD